MATPDERRTQARIAANARWAKEGDRVAATARARNNSPASLDYWLNKVDPDQRMPRADRLKRAENAKTAYYLRKTRDMRAAKARKAGEAAA